MTIAYAINHKLELSIMAYSMFKTNSIMTSATVACGKVALLLFLSMPMVLITYFQEHYEDTWIKLLIVRLTMYINNTIYASSSLELLSYNVLRIETRTIEPHTKLTITWFIILSLFFNSRLGFLNGKNNYQLYYAV